MTNKPKKTLGIRTRRLEELEPRAMLAGHGFSSGFGEASSAFFANAHSPQVASVAALSQEFRQESSHSNAFASSASFGHYDDSSSTQFTASLSDSSGDTATLTYQTGDLLGTSESVITVTGDTLDEGSSVAVTIGGTSIGLIPINSSGTGTLIVPTSSLSTAVAAGSAVTLGAAFTGTFAAATSTSSGDSGCGGSSAHSSLTASVSDASGDTATVTYQTGKLLGTSESVITVTGDTLDEGTSVALTIGGATIGTVPINSSGTGTLIVPTSNLSATVAAGNAITLGTLSGTLAAATSTTSGDSDDSGCGSSAHSSLTASVSDASGDTATVAYKTGKLLGTSESVITVTGDTLDEGTSVALSIDGTSIGPIAIDSTGSGTLIVSTSSLPSTVAAGSTVTLGTGLTGTFAAASSSDQSAHATVQFAARHRGRG